MVNFRVNHNVVRLIALLREEYDREQDAIIERQSRALGLKDEQKDVLDWYGGRIQQVLRLSRPTGNEFRYRLDQPVMKRSNRFARFLGSRRILQVKLSKELKFAKDQAAVEHLSSPFVLCGRVFVPFASKEGSVYMMEVNEDEDRNPDNSQGDDTRISLWDFIEWHNPMTLNQNQVRTPRRPCHFPDFFVAAYEQMVDAVRPWPLHVSSSSPV